MCTSSVKRGMALNEGSRRGSDMHVEKMGTRRLTGRTEVTREKIDAGNTAGSRFREHGESS